MKQQTQSLTPPLNCPNKWDHFNLLFDGTIDKEQYDKKVFECKDRQKAIDIELANHTDADKAYMLSAEALLKLASRISGIFESSKDDQKRQIIKLVFSNLSLTGDKLDYTLRSPFHMFVENPDRVEWRSRQDSNLQPSA